MKKKKKKIIQNVGRTQDGVQPATNKSNCITCVYITTIKGIEKKVADLSNFGKQSFD